MSVSDFLSFLHTKSKLKEQGVDETRDPEYRTFTESFATIQEDLGLYEKTDVTFTTENPVTITDIHNISDESIMGISDNSDSGALQEFAGGIESTAEIASTTYEADDIARDDAIEHGAYTTLT